MSRRFPASHAVLYATNVISGLLPQTRCFGIRRLLYGLAGVDIGANVRICGTSRIPHPNVFIGDDTWVGAGCELISTAACRVTVGPRCDLAPGVMLVAGSHQIGDHDRRASDRNNSAPVTVGAGTWLGTRSLLLAGSTVGAGSVVAAGAVVRGDFSEDSFIAGVPARLIRKLPR